MGAWWEGEEVSKRERDSEVLIASDDIVSGDSTQRKPLGRAGERSLWCFEEGKGKKRKRNTEHL